MAKLCLLALASLALVALVPTSQATSHPKTVCYYESWVHWRNGDGHMEPAEIDSSLCTHIVYAYFGIEAASHELKWLDPYLMKDLHDIEKFIRAKGSAKALIAIGGASMSDQFSVTAGNDQYRDQFARSVVSFLAQYQFDGIMIDWSGIQEKDGDNLIKVLDKFDEKFASTPYSIGITLPATVASLNFYNVPKITQYVDFINVLALDYAGPWAKVVGHASPLPEQIKTLEEYHKRGAPRSKLIMAVPLYARTWKLSSPSHQELGDAAVSGGDKGPYTQTEGLLSYNELCVLIKGNPSAFSIVRDNANTAVHAVYLHGGSAEFISYEDSKTLAAKAKNITTEGYGGMSIYTLSNEDVHGTCGKKYPLVHAIVDNYNKADVHEVPITTFAPHVTNPPTPPPTIPGIFKCPHEGKFRDLQYCFKYYDCAKGDFGIEQTVMHCERHEAFDETTQKCVDAKTVPGCH